MNDRRDPSSGLRLVGELLPYEDGAEDELLGILAGAADTSSRSDELVAHIHDWPTLYHLSRLRGNLVRPLGLRPGMRVLEVGCGTGAITRVLGETGADVLAVEGSLSRARAAAARCRDLPNVEVIAGPLDAVAEEVPEARAPFDAVVVIGVLEYSGTGVGGALGHASFLCSLRRHLGDTGVLALAIENQVGLKYLLGYHEDHHARPMVGLEDYPEGRGARTWSRAELGRMLDEVGLVHRRWLLPYPDYKLPTVLVDADALGDPAAAERLDRLIGEPILDRTAAPAFAARERDIHRVMLRAGLGAELANSFLVVASSDADGPDRLLAAHAAWAYGTETVGALAVERVLPEVGSVGLQALGGDRTFGPVRRHGDLPIPAGATVEDAVIRALSEGRDPSMPLRAWVAAVRSHTRPADVATPTPYLRAGASSMLPAVAVDQGPSRSILLEDAPGSRVELLPGEWSLGDGVESELGLLRGLGELAEAVRHRGVPTPWGADGRRLLRGLAVAAGLRPEEVDDPAIEDWADAEAGFRALVRGGSVADHRRALAEFLDGSVPTAPPRPEEIPALVAELADARALLAGRPVRVVRAAASLARRGRTLGRGLAPRR